MKFWQVDAFTNKIFSGNPAAVFIFDREPPTDLMLKIAREMNLSETAFVIKGVHLKIRWFTPNSEVNLCGHATLSAAHILWQEGLIENNKIIFQSRSGPLTVTKNANGYTLDFPLQPPREKSEYADQMFQLLGSNPEYIGSNGEDCMAVVSDDSIVHLFSPDHQKISAFNERGFLLTAQDKSGEFDYIYRGFFPKLNVPEDPVTGSANTCLAAYWSSKLNKKKLKARQVSERGGTLDVEVLHNRVMITGEAVTVFTGLMLLDGD
ncbi:MAG: PhzF family phenazine biosynthesis protein [Chlamydiales bacterium]|nr:PhzF family phenazine biosynthesis protein [Chlamydiales bacterium]